MEKITTQFTTHEEAEQWADENNYIIIMSSLSNGFITLLVIKKDWYNDTHKCSRAWTLS